MSLLSISVDLPVLDISYTWNQTVFVLLCLAYFTGHHVLKVHPCCTECQTFLLPKAVCGWTTFCLSIHHLMDFLGCSHLLATVNSATLNHSCTSFCLNTCFQSFWLSSLGVELLIGNCFFFSPIISKCSMALSKTVYTSGFSCPSGLSGVGGYSSTAGPGVSPSGQGVPCPPPVCPYSVHPPPPRPVFRLHGSLPNSLGRKEQGLRRPEFKYQLPSH